MALPKSNILTVLLALALIHHAHGQQVFIQGNVELRIQGGQAGGAVIINGVGGRVMLNANGVTTLGNRPKLTPAVEKALNEFAAKITLAKRKKLEAGMSKSVSEVIRVSQADEVAKAKLEAGARKAVDQIIAMYPEKLAEFLSRYLHGTEEQALASLSQWPQDDSERWRVPGLPDPENQPIWAETIKASLSPAQFTEWEKIADDKTRIQLKEITGHLKGSVDRMNEQFKGGMDTVIGEIATVLTLPGERLDKLKNKAADIVNRSVDAWREQQINAIRAMGETERRQLLAREGVSYSTTSSKLQRPEYQPEWKALLKAELSEAEFQRLEAAQKERSARRNKALAMLLVSEIDKRIGLSTTQRERLLPLALNPSRNLIRLNPTGEEGDEEAIEGAANWNLQPAYFNAAALKMPEAEVRAVLDPAQWPHWQDYCKNNQENVYQQIQVKAATDGKEEDLDGLVNEYLHKSAQYAEQRLVKNMRIRVEDVTRIVKLQPEAVAQLTLAARGAIERTMETNRDSLNVMVNNHMNNNLQGLGGEEFRNQLAALGNMGENISRNKNPHDHPLWTDSFKSILTPEQYAIWQSELNARSAFRDQVTTAMVTAELDRQLRLTKEQFDKLERLIAKIIKDYSPTIINHIGIANGYWNSGNILVPIAGIPEDELNAILTAEPAKTVKARLLAQTRPIWKNLQLNHERLKATKTGASVNAVPLRQ